MKYLSGFNPNNKSIQQPFNFKKQHTQQIQNNHIIKQTNSCSGSKHQIVRDGKINY